MQTQFQINQKRKLEIIHAKPVNNKASQFFFLSFIYYMQQRYVDDYSALSSCGALIKFELFIYPKKPYELGTTKGTKKKNNNKHT